MSCVALRHKVLLQTGEEGAGPWVALDVRYKSDVERSLQIYLQDGDTVTIQGITKEFKGGDLSFLDNLSNADISDLKTYTESTADILNGTFTYIRAVKVGTNGFAKVQGFV